MSDKRIDVRLALSEISYILRLIEKDTGQSSLYDRLEAECVRNYEIPSMSISTWNEKFGEDHEEK